MLGFYSILIMQIDGIKGIGQGIVKDATGGVVVHRNHSLALDAIGLPARGFVHHPVDGGVFATGDGFEELEQAQHALSTG